MLVDLHPPLKDDLHSEKATHQKASGGQADHAAFSYWIDICL
jgi:hypothetical protein